MQRITECNMKLWRQVGDLSGQRILDVSCGAGHSTAGLTGLGAQVTCTNYSEERPPQIPSEAHFVGGVDLNQRWPFDDESFDGVHIQEVIEHLQNTTHVVAEIARVLRKGGTVVLSTPNILNLSSRLAFFFTGFYEGRRHPIGYSKGIGDAGNVYMTNVSQLHYLMAHHGLSVRALGRYRVKLQTYLLVPMIPVIALCTYLTTRRPRKSWMMDRDERRDAPDELLTELVGKQRSVARRVRRLMLSPQCLLSRNLLVRAEKTCAAPFDA